MTWTTRIAAWTEARPDDGFADPQRRAVARLRELVDEAGAIPVGPISLKVSTDHSRPGRRDVFLAEVAALIVRHPNPFPRIRLFRWLPA